MQTLTASIVTYHTDIAELEKCLSCLCSDRIKRIDIIDNGNESRIRDWAKSQNKVNYQTANNPGFGAADNIAIKKAIAEEVKYHLILNSDIIFEAKVIDHLCDYMDNNPTVGMVQPKIIYPDGQLQYTCRRLPTPLDVFGRRFLPKQLFSCRNNKYLLRHLNMDLPHNIPYLQGSFMFIRTAALKDIGLFDERFFMYPEDIDLSRRIHRNWQTMYYPECVVTHFHRAESYKSINAAMIHITNMIRYFNKWGWWYDPERRLFNKSIR